MGSEGVVARLTAAHVGEGSQELPVHGGHGRDDRVVRPLPAHVGVGVAINQVAVAQHLL